MRHTSLSRALMLLALVPAVVALMLGNAVLLLLAGLLVLVLVRARDGVPEEATIELQLDKTRVQRSNPIQARLEATLPESPYLGIAHQPLPETFVLADGSNLALVEPGESVARPFTFASPRRGAYELDAPDLSLAHPLELAPITPLVSGRERDIIVEPIVRPLRTVKGLRGPARDKPGEDPAIRGPASTEFEELREYHRGDPLKNVNWKATAKNSTRDLELIVNEYEPEARKNVWFFLDLHASLEVGTTLETALEDAIDITLALVHHFTARGHRVGGATYNGPNPELFYPDVGSRQELIIARSLARVRPGQEHEGLPAAVERAKGFLSRERPLTFVITRPDLHPDDLLTGVRRIHRHTATNRKAAPVKVLAPEPPAGSPHDRLARALSSLEAEQSLSRDGSKMLRIHRLEEGARGLERALAKGVLAR